MPHYARFRYGESHYGIEGAGTIATSTQELRQFLDGATNATRPVIYTDRAGHRHQAFLTKVDEVARSLKRDEAILALTMIETVPETQEAGASGSRAQEIFLLQCVDAPQPVEYEDRLNRKHRVFLTRMELKKRAARKSPDEWLYALTMVDAWGGVLIYELPALKVTATTTFTLQDHVTDLIGSANSIGWAQIGQ